MNTEPARLRPIPIYFFRHQNSTKGDVEEECLSSGSIELSRRMRGAKNSSPNPIWGQIEESNVHAHRCGHDPRGKLIDLCSACAETFSSQTHLARSSAQACKLELHQHSTPFIQNQDIARRQ